MTQKKKRQSVLVVITALIGAAFMAYQSGRTWYGIGLLIIAAGVFLYYDYIVDKEIDFKIEEGQKLPEGVDEQTFKEMAELFEEYGPEVAEEFQDRVDEYTKESED